MYFGIFLGGGRQMRKVVAVLAAVGLLAFILGCQAPGGFLEKMNEMEKDTAELKAQVEKLTEAIDELSKNVEELAESYEKHMKKYHKSTTYTAPKPVKKRTR